MSLHSTSLTIGRDKHGTPNALYDGLSRVVVSFPADRTYDTRRGSPSTPETIEANARLFAAAPELHAALMAIATLAALAAKTFPNAPGRGDFQSIGAQAAAALAKATA